MKFSLSLAALLMSASFCAAAQPAATPAAPPAASTPVAATPAAAPAVVPAIPAAAATPVAAPAATPAPSAAAPAAATSAAAATADGQPEMSMPASAAGAAAASVSPAQAQAITQTFEKRFPGIHVDSVRATPLQGIFEVQVGMDLLYSDAGVNYVLQGSLIDAKARRDLTAERLETLQQVAFDTLPLKDAIQIVKGDGSRKLATFEDPNCPYCKQLHHTLGGIDNVTVYVFLYPILTPDSATRARDIWCSADRAKAWTDWMVDGKAPAKTDCKTPIQANLALGRKLNVQGTPALFFGNGVRVNGALPLAALKQKLDAEGKG